MIIQLAYLISGLILKRAHDQNDGLGYGINME